MATDYLTCGQCLREFPLQCITRFIQHKKLDCEDDTDVQSQDPELKCNYCPQGFMTAWALLVHAQLTHNLKIFLEKASKSLLNQVKFSSIGKGSNSDSPGKGSNSDPPSLLTNCTPILEDKVCSIKDLPVKSDENSGKSLTPKRDKIVDQSTEINVSQSITGISPEQSKMGSNIIVTRNILTGSKEVGEKTGLQQVHRNFEKTVTSSNVPVLQSSELNSGQKINIFPMNQTSVSLLPKLSVLPISVSSGQIMSGNFKVIPTVLARTVTQTLPESPAQSATSTFVTVLKKEVQHGNSVGSIDNHCLDHQKKTSESPSVLLPTSMIVSPLSSTRISKLVTHSVDLLQIPNSTEIACKAKPVDDTSVENQRKPEDNSVAQFDASNNVSQQADMEDVEVETPASECCDSQGCGVTVIPGSHENLQECCNAVLPKKRKRHMEQKHMPFSWSSSRYARRKMLFRSLSSSATRSTASQYVPKPSTGTIFIDLEPDSSNSGDKQANGHECTAFKVTQSATPDVRILGSSNTSVPSSSVSVSHSKPHSLILKPGAVYSIPFTYTVPSSKSVATFPIPRQPISLAEPVQQSGSSSSLSSLSELPNMTTVEGDQAHIDTNSILTNVNQTVEVQALQDEIVRRNTSSKPFQCDRCTMGFNQRIHLKKHMSKHTGIKPYKCGECNYSTVERSHLKVHIRIHTGEKPFKCTYCEYATAQNSTLKIHLKRHHGGKMFQCHTCEKQFTQEEQLKGHEWEHGTRVVTSPEEKTLDIKPTPVLTNQTPTAHYGNSTSSQSPALPSAAQTRKSQVSPQASSCCSSPEEVKSCHTANQHQRFSQSE